MFKKVYSTTNDRFMDKFLITKASFEKLGLADDFTLLYSGDKDLNIDNTDVVNKDYNSDLLMHEFALQIGDIIPDDDDISAVALPGVMARKLSVDDINSKYVKSDKIESSGIIKTATIMNDAKFYFNGNDEYNEVQLFLIKDVSMISEELYLSINRNYQKFNMLQIPGASFIFGKNKILKDYYNGYVEFYNNNKVLIDDINSHCPLDGDTPPETFRNPLFLYNVYKRECFNISNLLYKNLYSHTISDINFKETIGDTKINYIDFTMLFKEGHLENIKDMYDL